MSRLGDFFLFNRKVLQTSLLNKKRSAKDEHSHEKKVSAEADRALLTKWSKSLMNEGFRELKWTCPLCSCIGKFSKLSYTTKSFVKELIAAALQIRFFEHSQEKKMSEYRILAATSDYILYYSSSIKILLKFLFRLFNINRAHLL